MGLCFGKERRAPGPRGTEKLLDPGDRDYDKNMSKQWGGPPPLHYPSCWETWPATYKGTGKVALVTGGTAGIGFYVAKMLAHLDYTLILPARTGFDDEAQGALSAIQMAVPTAKVFMPDEKLDLESLQSVRNFAASLRLQFKYRIALSEYKKIDLLCLNAGRGGSNGDRREETCDGIEAIMQVNAVSHMLLAAELMPLLRASPAARIVSQSSGARFCEAPGLQKCKVSKLADMNATGAVNKPYNAFHQYQISKTCNVFFTLGMNQRLKAAGIENVKAFSCEPGFASTGVNIQHNLGHSFLGCMDGCLSTKTLHNILAHHAADASLPMVLASVDPEPDTSMFFHPAGGMKGMARKFDPTVGDPRKNAAKDPANVKGSDWPKDSAEVFWRQAQQFTGDLTVKIQAKRPPVSPPSSPPSSRSLRAR